MVERTTEGALEIGVGASALAPGAHVGRYRIEKVLGQGGMGLVYLAEDTALGRRVALKVVALPASLGSVKTTEAKARLLREARAAASLEHPTIVSIYDVGEHEGAPFLAMEFVGGETLRARMERPSTLDERVAWLVEIARALEVAHASGLIHRDVKPENVMIKPDGSVKVLDFGIARRPTLPVDPGAPTEQIGGGLGTITAEGALIGTPLYMAPEQLMGSALDGRSDQFAWAVVAYELLSGKPPWSPDDAVALIACILGKEPEPLVDSAPDVPPAIASVVHRALAKRAEGRFASMAEVLAALGASRGPRVSAAPPTRLGPWLIAAVAALAIAVTAIAATRQKAPASVASPPSAPSPTVTSSARAGVAITELPLPHSAVPEAVAAYKAGLQAIRDGASESARRHFEAARRLDPTMSAAFFRGFTWLEPSESASMVELMHQALDRRADLPEHEALLLDATAPCAQHRGGEDRHCVDRVRELTRRFPEDAEYAMVLASQLNAAGRMADSKTAAERAIALDPKFAAAWLWLGYASWYLGDLAAAAKQFDSGASAAPGVDCLVRRGWLALQEGDSDAVRDRGQRALAADPGSLGGLGLLERSAVCTGASDAAVAAIDARLLAATPDADRELATSSNRFEAAFRRGDFAEYLRALEALKPLVAQRRDFQSHRDLVLATTLLSDEIGRPDLGADAARAYFDGGASLVDLPSDDDGALATESFGLPLRALRRAGKLTKAELTAERDRWIRRWEPRLGPDYRPYLWLEAFVCTVDDADDAREAIAALPRYGGLPPRLDQMPFHDLIGRMYLLAGRTDDAIAWLERGAKACWDDANVLHSHIWLGKALEQRGDQAKACDAYAYVLKHWANAKPKSVTADEAKKRSKALGCTR